MRYEFRESWTVVAPPEEVCDVLLDLEHYPTWWPQVVAVASLGPDDSRVLCRSALPYTLDLVMHAVRRELPVLEVALDGDLTGYARWRLTPTPAPDGAAATRMDYEQRVERLRRAHRVVGGEGLRGVVGRDLQVSAGLQVDVAQLRPPPRRRGAALLAGRDRLDQLVGVEDDRPQPVERPQQRLRGPAHRLTTEAMTTIKRRITSAVGMIRRRWRGFTPRF